MFTNSIRQPETPKLGAFISLGTNSVTTKIFNNCNFVARGKTLFGSDAPDFNGKI